MSSNHANRPLPFDPLEFGDAQTAIPAIAKSPALVAQIEECVRSVATRHSLYNIDSRRLDFLEPESVHLIVTSPPYWTLKEYERDDGQLGYLADYDEFHEALNEVWANCFRFLVPGGRLVCVVGDVCLSRRQNGGTHTVVPLHATIQENCRRIGFANLAPIIWHKIANASYEAGRSSGGFLGKPYEPNAVLKNDIEFVLMQRKPGGYRSPSLHTRALSVIPAEKHREWFQQIWTGVTGASTRDHPAPFPIEIATRLIRMFSFVGDTVLDPFMGTGTTTLAAMQCGRNSVGAELSPKYFAYAGRRLRRVADDLYSKVELTFHQAPAEAARGETLVSVLSDGRHVGS